MFKNWFKKTPLIKSTPCEPPTAIEDEMEKSLWEIKEEYDLPTEEIVNVVYSKRSNIDIMHQAIRKSNKEKV